MKNNVLRVALLSVAASVATLGNAQAEICGDYGNRAFSCVIEKNKKTVSVCVNAEKMMRYTYGADELVLYASAADSFDGFFNYGVGRYIWHEATFQNEGYSYIVASSVDKLDENLPMEGSVQVLKAGENIASLRCDQKSVYNAMDMLYD